MLERLFVLACSPRTSVSCGLIYATLEQYSRTNDSVFTSIRSGDGVLFGYWHHIQMTYCLFRCADGVHSKFVATATCDGTWRHRAQGVAARWPWCASRGQPLNPCSMGCPRARCTLPLVRRAAAGLPIPRTPACAHRWAWTTVDRPPFPRHFPSRAWVKLRALCINTTIPPSSTTHRCEPTPPCPFCC